MGPAAMLGLMACSPRPPAVQPGTPGPGTPTPPADVLVIEQGELDAIRAKYTLSEPRGEVTATATCATGEAGACMDAARQQLREEAKKRGATLVVVVSAAMTQSIPARLALRGTVYEIRPRD